jgi:hypothetical protein
VRVGFCGSRGWQRGKGRSGTLGCWFIALEKTLPWRQFAARGTAIVLAVLAAFIIVEPSTIPGLTTPSNRPMQQMSTNM